VTGTGRQSLPPTQGTVVMGISVTDINASVALATAN